MNIVVLNIGNTHVQITEAPAFAHIDEIPTGQFDPSAIDGKALIAASTVVPRFREALEKRGAFVVSPAKIRELDFSLVDPATIGGDRAANAVKLAADGILPAMTLDFGTAINCEIVDACRRFAGGVIMPGRLLMRKTLNLYTAQLPEIPLFNGLPDFPGQNTRDALRLGTDGVLLSAVRALVDQAIEKYRPLRIIAIGGDRHFFMNHISMEDGGDDFTLRGIYLAALHNKWS